MPPPSTTEQTFVPVDRSDDEARQTATTETVRRHVAGLSADDLVQLRARSLLRQAEQSEYERRLVDTLEREARAANASLGAPTVEEYTAAMREVIAAMTGPAATIRRALAAWDDARGHTPQGEVAVMTTTEATNYPSVPADNGGEGVDMHMTVAAADLFLSQIYHRFNELHPSCLPGGSDFEAEIAAGLRDPETGELLEEDAP